MIWDMTFEEYFSLFSKYRREKIALVDSYGDGAWRAYIHHDDYKPVCSWTNRESRSEGRMHVRNARIMMAKESLAMFQIKAGERHRPDSIQKMCKPKTEKTRAKMALGQQKRRERERNEK